MAEQNTSKKHVHFHNLDVLRFLAAFMIVLVHGYFAVIGWEGLPEPIRKDPSITLPIDANMNSFGIWLKMFVDNFDLGVEFFFLISGFLITYLMLSEIDATGKLNIPRFYMRRLLRIWPLFYLIIIITPFIAHWTQAAEPDYWWNIFFANNYKTILSRTYEPGLEHYWSICVEEHFYIVWPLLLSVIPVKRMPQLFATIIFIAIASRVFYFYTSPEWYNHAKLNTLSRMDTMAIGGWLAWTAHRRPFTFNVSGWIRILVYATFLFAICTEDRQAYSGVFMVAFKRFIYTGFFAFLLLNYLYNPKAWFNFKKKNILHYLGKVSFGIYMYHNILFGLIFKKIFWRYHLEGFWTFWIIYIPLVLLISVLSYELYETHFLKLKDKFAIISTSR
jgi:peptidoglycan/LPS O-acetylase OafA/YrhL